MKTKRPILFTFHLLLQFLTFLSTLYPISAVSIDNRTEIVTRTDNGTDFIRTSCGTTLYPDLCYNSLSRYGNAIQRNPAQLTRVAIAVSLTKAKRMAVYVYKLSRDADYGSADARATSALHDCFTNFGEAVEEIHDSLKQMKSLSSGDSFKFQMSNVQTWMSAALTDQETCTDGFEDVGDCPVKTEVTDRAGKVKKYTSNALALANRYAENGSP